MATQPARSYQADGPGLGKRDRSRLYHESALAVDEAVTVLGVAQPADATAAVDDEVTITAGETATEFVLTPGCERQARRHLAGAIVGCALASLALGGGGLLVLVGLAGVG